MRAVKRELEDTTVFPPAASIFTPRGVWICSLRKWTFAGGRRMGVMQSERHNGLSERRQQSAYLIVARIRFLCGAAPCKTASSESFVLTNPCGRKCSLDETTEFWESLYRKCSVFAGAERKSYFPLAFQEQTLHDIVNYLVKIVSRAFETRQDRVYSAQFFYSRLCFHAMQDCVLLSTAWE